MKSLAAFSTAVLIGCSSQTPAVTAPAGAKPAPDAPAASSTTTAARAPAALAGPSPPILGADALPGRVAVVDSSSVPLEAGPVMALHECTPADWSAHALEPLLVRGKGETSTRSGLQGHRDSLFDAECTDAPAGATNESTEPRIADGVRIRVSRAADAGMSGRRWRGNRCEFEVRLANGAGVPVVLAQREVAPFNTIRAVVRAGSAAWFSVGFNGYTREFPGGGNRIIAVDLCQGRIVWQSKDGLSNGGLLLLDDYLISPYGFTSERRYVFVLDARSGRIVQKLPVVENVCPSARWAPHWQPGERCDAPGQLVGAATDPRIEEGAFLVDTNTGSSKFYFR